MLSNIPAGTHPRLLGTWVMGPDSITALSVVWETFQVTYAGRKLTTKGIPALPGRQGVQMKWAPPHKHWWLSSKESACNAGDLKEMRVWSLGQEDPLELEIATHSSILAWKIPVDRGDWQAAVHGVWKSWIWPSNWRTNIPEKGMGPCEPRK